MAKVSIRSVTYGSKTLSSGRGCTISIMSGENGTPSEHTSEFSPSTLAKVERFRFSSVGSYM